MTFEITEQKVMEAAKRFRRSKSVLEFLFPHVKTMNKQTRILRERAYSIRKIESVVCSYFGCDVQYLLKRRRLEDVVKRRSILMYISYRYADITGEALAKRYKYDRSTLIHHANLVLGQIMMHSDNSYKYHAQKIYDDLCRID